MDTNHKLIPVVYWFTQERNADYDACLMEVLEKMHAPAGHYLAKAFRKRRDGHHPDGIVFEALYAHQQTILEPYVPKLRISSPDPKAHIKSITCIWKEWMERGMVVELANGMLDKLKPPLPDHEQQVKRTFDEDSREYEFKFFRNDSDQQRERWFRCVLREWIERYRTILMPNRERLTEETDLEILNADFHDPVPFQIFWRDVRKLIDPDDRMALAVDRSHAAGGERMRRCRALKHLQTAAWILIKAPHEDQARCSLYELRHASDGKRTKILNSYANRDLPNVCTHDEN